MIRIWLLRDGTILKDGDEPLPYGMMRFEDCVNKLGLRDDDFLVGLEKPLKIGRAETHAAHRGPKHVILKLDLAEAQQRKWKPGFYAIPRISALKAAKMIKARPAPLGSR